MELTALTPQVFAGERLDPADCATLIVRGVLIQLCNDLITLLKVRAANSASIKRTV